MLVPSGVVTGVGVFATVGVIAVVGVALKAGILIGQTSKNYAEKQSAATGEWVEPKVVVAVTDALGRYMARNTLNTGKKIALFGVKQASKKISTKIGDKIPEGIAVSRDLTQRIKDYAIKVATAPATISEEKVLEVEDLLISLEDIENRPYPTIVDADYLNAATAVIFSTVIDRETGTEEEPVATRNIEDEIFLAGKPLNEKVEAEPVVEEVTKTEPVKNDAEEAEQTFDINKAKEKIASVFTEENLDNVVDFAVKNRNKVLGYLNKKLDKDNK
jgi:hypothetical protein